MWLARNKRGRVGGVVLSYRALPFHAQLKLFKQGLNHDCHKEAAGSSCHLVTIW